MFEVKTKKVWVNSGMIKLFINMEIYGKTNGTTLTIIINVGITPPPTNIMVSNKH